MIDFEDSRVLTTHEVRQIAGAEGKNPMAIEHSINDNEASWRGLVVFDMPIDRDRSVRKLAHIDMHAIGGDAHFSPQHGVFVAMTVLNKGLPAGHEEFEIHEDMHGFSILQTAITGIRVVDVTRRDYYTRDRSPNEPLTPHQFIAKNLSEGERRRIMLNQAVLRGLRKSAGLPL